MKVCNFSQFCLILVLMQLFYDMSMVYTLTCFWKCISLAFLWKTVNMYTLISISEVFMGFINTFLLIRHFECPNNISRIQTQRLDWSMKRAVPMVPLFPTLVGAQKIGSRSTSLHSQWRNSCVSLAKPLLTLHLIRFSSLSRSLRF